MMHKRYTKEQCTAAEAQRLAQEIAFGPVVFQVSRLMLKFGIFQLLSGKREGYTLQEISGQTGLTRYAAQVLLEASLTIGTILLEEDRYVLAKAGWFLLNDKMARVNMEFNHDVNYQGLFHLEEALLNGRPEGLKVFGESDAKAVTEAVLKNIRIWICLPLYRICAVHRMLMSLV